MHRRVVAGRKDDFLLEFEKFLNAAQPKLVILSTGGIFPPIEWLEFCRENRLPFVTICQANSRSWWFDDETAARYGQALRAALRCYFVSEGNLRLAEKQIGAEFSNAEVVRNPFNVDYNTSLPWPSIGKDGAIRLACVGRLEPVAKGQDILLEALATPIWIDRPWHLTLYGDGPFRIGIRRLVQRFGLEDRVTLAGWVSDVKNIWAENHVLVMPSRYEGLPMAMVEAMLCGRPIAATDVGGHSEIVEDSVSGFVADAPTVTSLTGALDRLWKHRHDLKKMGEVAQREIRKSVPADPAAVFSQKIQSLLTAPSEMLSPASIRPEAGFQL
jgi:glycosyltransferase involved in cell wall biosynthesis